jgi:hypothetical protein
MADGGIVKRLLVGLLLFSLLAGAVACASAKPASVEYSQAGTPESGKAYPAPVATVAPTIAVPPVTVAAPTFGSNEIQAGLSDTSQSWSGERLIIRTGNMALVVDDVARVLEDITGLASSFDGYVVSSNSWKEGERLAGNIAIRVPAARFDEAVQTIRGLAVEVTSESTSGQDVTEEYVDLNSKLKNLEASEAQLLKLMEQAGKVEEILQVQRELTSTRGEIEQTKGRMQYLEKSAAMSLIQVSLSQSKLGVEFTAGTRSVKTGQSIPFSAKISGGFAPYSYQWDFGDGSTSTSDAPSHAYKSKGSYTVTLKVTDDKGNTASQEREGYITVLPGWDAGSVASSAWNGFLAFGRVVINILIWLAVFIPLWIVIGVIVYFAWWRRRKKA